MDTVVSRHELSIVWLHGQRQRSYVIGLALVAAASLLLAGLVLTTGVVAVAAVATVLALMAMAVQPRLGLYLMLAILLLFDGQFLDPFMLPGRYISSSLQTSLKINGGVLIPFEMLVLLVALLRVAHAAMRRQFDWRGGFLGRFVLFFALMLLCGMVRGLISNGNFNYSVWESRFLFAMVLSYFVAANTIRTRAHVRMLLNIIFVCAIFSALDGIFRKYVLIPAGVLGTAQENWFSHEDVVIWGLALLLVIAQQAFGGPRWQRWLGPIVALLTLFTMLASERRAGLIAVMIAFALFSLALLTIKRRAFLFIALPGLLAAMIYLPLFWNNTSTLGQGARAIRSVSAPDQRDAASNAWRDLEAINVRATIASDPLLGIGFGRPFLQVVHVPDISFFEFWNYESHHDVLWVWMKTGAIGFISFFLLLLGSIGRSVWLARHLQYPELKTFAAITMAAVVLSLVFCYVDLGLTGNRVPVLLGVMLGTCSVLEKVS
jgi:hypothetical protein